MTSEQKVKQKYPFRRSAREFPANVAKKLIADEREREKRDKKRVKYCPVCGATPEIPFLNEGRHIYTGHCEKCQVRFVITHPTTLELAERVAAWFKNRASADDEEFAASFAAAALPGCIKNMVLADKGLVRIEDMERVLRDAWISFGMAVDFNVFMGSVRCRLAPNPERTPEELIAGVLRNHFRGNAGWLDIEKCTAGILAALKEQGGKAE